MGGMGGFLHSRQMIACPARSRSGRRRYRTLPLSRIKCVLAHTPSPSNPVRRSTFIPRSLAMRDIIATQAPAKLLMPARAIAREVDPLGEKVDEVDL